MDNAPHNGNDPELMATVRILSMLQQLAAQQMVSGSQVILDHRGPVKRL